MRGHRASKKSLIAAALVIAALAILAPETGGVKKALGETKILFVGDMMFDRTMRRHAEERGYGHLFSCVAGYLQGFDLAVGNLEGPITLRESLSLGTKPGDADNTRFTFAAESAAALAEANVRAVSLGNNHIWDFGREGAESAMSVLRENGILYFGAPNGSDLATTTIRGSRIALVSYNQFLGEDRPEETVSTIWKARKESDFVAVYSHWGEEYEPATAYQKALAHRFIDAGADIVIGSHPHVIQGHEIYKGKHVFYSLGNFIFDQYWNEEVRTGAGVEVSLGKGEIKVAERRFDLSRDGRVCIR